MWRGVLKRIAWPTPLAKAITLLVMALWAVDHFLSWKSFAVMAVNVGWLWWILLSDRGGRATLELAGGDNNLCPSCGYDLRATPKRCPECGRETAPAAGVPR